MKTSMYLKIAQRLSAGDRVLRGGQSRKGRKKGSAVPRGTASIGDAENPALKHWAIFGIASKSQRMKLRLEGRAGVEAFGIASKSIGMKS
jgi:hypothetical protein